MKKEKKATRVSTFTQVKELNPRDIDQKYIGNEPLFNEQPPEHSRNSVIARSLNWYQRFYGRKDAREMMAIYLSMHDREADAKIMRKVDEAEFKLPTFAWLSRMVLRGFQLNEHEMMTLENEISRLLATITKPSVKVKSRFTSAEATSEELAVTKTNIQDTMREKAREVIGALEGLYDDFYNQGSPTKHTFKPIDEIVKQNILPAHVGMIKEIWNKKLEQLNLTLVGKDAFLVQAYSNLGKQQLKNTIKFVELVLGDLNSYINVKKTAKAPRARKAVPVEKIVSKVKYLKTFTDAATKLELVSVSPVKLHGSSEAYLYDTQLRKLIYVVADEYSKTLSIKGTSILGIDAAKSQTKTLRKPAEQLKEFMKLGKPAGRKFFEAIKAVATIPKGRLSDRIVILRAT